MTDLLDTSAHSVAVANDAGPTGRPGTVALRYEAVERAITAMRERLEEPLSLDAIAGVAMLSRYHFSRVFLAATGLPPGRFLAALRLAEAKRLLLTTRASVTDVCFRVGYSSLGTFTTRFTQSVGLSPGRFRQLPQTTRSLGTPYDEKGYLADIGRSRATVPGGLVTGCIRSSMRMPGPIFVGLFHTSVPGGQPACCAVLPTPGFYHIPQVPEGSYHLFAASFPWPEDILACLLPDSRSALVGNVRCPVPVRRGQVTSHVNVSLRPPAATDPPILVALPALLPRRLGGDNGCQSRNLEEAFSTEGR